MSNRFFKNRGIRCNTAYTVILNQFFLIAIFQELAANVINPDALSKAFELFKRIIVCHGMVSFPNWVYKLKKL